MTATAERPATTATDDAPKNGRAAAGSGARITPAELDARLAGHRGSGAGVMRTILAAPPADPLDTSRVHDLPLADVAPSRLNPRRRFDPARLKELATSIQEQGLIEPIVVRPATRHLDLEGYQAVLGELPATPPRYELVAGERRWRASVLAAIPTVRAIVREDLVEDHAGTLLKMLVENGQRDDLSPLEAARAYDAYFAEAPGVTVEAFAKSIGKSQPYVSNKRRLLKLPKKVLELIDGGKLNEAQSRALLKWTDFPKFVVPVAEAAVKHGWTSTQLEDTNFLLSDENNDAYQLIDDLAGAGVLDEVPYGTRFRRDVCAKACPFGAFLSAPGVGIDFCLRPDHLKELVAQEDAENARAVEEHRAKEAKKQASAAKKAAKQTTTSAPPRLTAADLRRQREESEKRERNKLAREECDRLALLAAEYVGRRKKLTDFTNEDFALILLHAITNSAVKFDTRDTRHVWGQVLARHSLPDRVGRTLERPQVLYSLGEDGAADELDVATLAKLDPADQLRFTLDLLLAADCAEKRSFSSHPKRAAMLVDRGKKVRSDA